MIEEVSPDSPYYKQVVELGDANSKTLGFLPYEAISHAAAEGRVLAYVEDRAVKGYALFGKRARTGDISLTHLCVDHSERGQGIARQLVEGIVERHQHRAAIRLACRKDYDANAMWPHLGFERIGEKPGRSREGLPLVTWIRPIAARTLFEEPEQDDARMVVAIDTNILLDILEQRDFPRFAGAHRRLGRRSRGTGRDGTEPLRTVGSEGQERELRVSAGRVPHLGPHRGGVADETACASGRAFDRPPG